MIGKVIPINDNGQLCITKYNTQMLYGDLKSITNPNEMKYSNGFHFDYDIDVQPAHPIFHVQQEPGAADQWTGYDHQLRVIAPEHSPTPNKSIRIPTAQMDIFSAMLMVLADHCIDTSKPQQVDSFCGLLSNTKDYIPKVKLDSHQNLFENHLAGMDHLKSNAWYPAS